MRLTIIVPDKAVYKDGVFYNELSWVGTPEGTHALQWFGANGWVEYNDGTPNQNITTLPAWVNNALASWEEANAPKPEPEPTQAEKFEMVRNGLQGAIDAKAITFGFSSGNALMLYAGFTNPFQTLAQTFATWEAGIWVEAEAYRQEVLAGAKPMLTPEQAIALMPAYPGA